MKRIVSSLNELIDQLRKVEPYWNKCYPCINKGKCCIGADPSFTENEWEATKQQIKNFEATHLEKLKLNVNTHVTCPFRTETECLIHRSRPLNCMYTPFQAFLRLDNKVAYSMDSPNCDFETTLVPYDPSSVHGNIIELNSFGVKRKYLLLNNWVIDHGFQNEPVKFATQLLKEYFSHP